MLILDEADADTDVDAGAIDPSEAYDGDTLAVCATVTLSHGYARLLNLLSTPLTRRDRRQLVPQRLAASVPALAVQGQVLDLLPHRQHPRRTVERSHTMMTTEERRLRLRLRLPARLLLQLLGARRLLLLALVPAAAKESPGNRALQPQLPVLLPEPAQPRQPTQQLAPLPLPRSRRLQRPALLGPVLAVTATARGLRRLLAKLALRVLGLERCLTDATVTGIMVMVTVISMPATVKAPMSAKLVEAVGNMPAGAAQGARFSSSQGQALPPTMTAAT